MKINRVATNKRPAAPRRAAIDYSKYVVGDRFGALELIGIENVEWTLVCTCGRTSKLARNKVAKETGRRTCGKCVTRKAYEYERENQIAQPNVFPGYRLIETRKIQDSRWRIFRNEN